jgi:hypothetical protein
MGTNPVGTQERKQIEEKSGIISSSLKNSRNTPLLNSDKTQNNNLARTTVLKDEEI